MKVSYLIQCHKNINQIETLVESLNLSDLDCVIFHVDKKSNDLLIQMKILFIDYKNIYFIDNPESVSWSGFSQVKATLKMINFLYSNKIDFDYCCLLSGEDVPINSHKFKNYLAEKKLSFLEFRNDREKYFWRVNRINVLRENKYSKSLFVRAVSSFFIKCQVKFFPKRNNFLERDIHLGSCWFVIKNEHLKLILDNVDENFISKFKYTSCSDEHFFQILFKKYLNSSFYEVHNLHYVFFENSCASPRYLSLSDLNNLENKEDIFFARKVTESVASDFLEYKKRNLK